MKQHQLKRQCKYHCTLTFRNNKTNYTPIHVIFSNYPLKFFSIVVAISNALFNKTILPANVPMSRAAMDAAITAANANDTFRTIRQQTPPVNISQNRNQSSHHSGSHRHYR